MAEYTTDEHVRPRDVGERPPSRRAAKKERTRRGLIEAAAEVFAERGFHAASLAEVAARAGLTTGAVYSNFRGKEDLFFAVIREMALPLDLGSDAATPWERLGRAAVLAARGVDLPATRRLLKLQLEFALLTLGDPALLRAFVDDLRGDRDDLADLLATGGPAPVPAFRPSATELATAVIASLQGLLQHRFLDPDAVPEELAGWVVQALLHVGGSNGGVG